MFVEVQGFRYNFATKCCVSKQVATQVLSFGSGRVNARDHLCRAAKATDAQLFCGNRAPCKDIACLRGWSGYIPASINRVVYPERSFHQGRGHMSTYLRTLLPVGTWDLHGQI